jgi:hypothetical protein
MIQQKIYGVLHDANGKLYPREDKREVASHHERIEEELLDIFYYKFGSYRLNPDDREMIQFTALESDIRTAHFSEWVSTHNAKGWRFLAVGGVNLLIESYDDEFPIFERQMARQKAKKATGMKAAA